MDRRKGGKIIFLVPNAAGNNIPVYFMEKDAAEKLLKNAKVWKIPDDEVDMIKTRLQIFINELKQRGL